jgi:hypothetical protein
MCIIAVVLQKCKGFLSACATKTGKHSYKAHRKEQDGPSPSYIS